MSRLLKENQKASKENLRSIITDFSMKVNRVIDKTGKSQYQIALENLDKRNDFSVYNNLLFELYNSLSTEKKRDVFNALSKQEQERNRKNAKESLRGELVDAFTADQVFEVAKQRALEAKNNEERIEAMKPYLSSADFSEFEKDPSVARVNASFDKLSAQKQKVKDAYLGEIQFASSIEKAKELVSPFIPQEKLAHQKYSELNITGPTLDKHSEMFLSLIVENLSDEKIDEIVTKHDKSINPAERDLAQTGTHNLADNTAAMKQKVDNDPSINAEDKEQIKVMMDRINTNTVSHRDDPDYHFFDDRRKEVEEALTRDAKIAGENALREMEIDPQVTEAVFDSTAKDVFDVVPEGKEQNLERMREMDMIFSDQTKNAIKEVFNKFDQYGYNPTGMQQEEGTKAYALSNYNNAMVDYVAALKQQNVQESVRFAKELNKEETQIKDILNVVHQNFPMNETDAYPGNVDVLRNASMPAEFRKDVRGVGYLNALYGVYSYIKANNLNVDEFLNSPMQNINKFYVEGAYKSLSSTELIKGKSGAEAIYALQKNPASNKQYGGFGMPRIVETLGCLESNPELRKHNSATQVAFQNGTALPFQRDFFTSRNQHIAKNQEIIDRLLIVKEPQKDGKLLNYPSYNPITCKVQEAKGFDEAEYISRSQESPSEFLQRLQNNVVSYIELNETTDENDKTLSNNDFVRAAQKAAVKYLMVKGLGNTFNKPMNDRTADERAIAKMMDFVKDGKVTVNGWIDNKYMFPPAGQPVLEEKAARLKDAYECNNPYANMVDESIARYEQRKNQPGDITPYANGESAKKTIEEKKAYLTESFRDGKVPEMFYQARMAQLNNGEENREMPPFFAADSLGDVDEYIENNYDAETAQELSNSEKNYLYGLYIDRAKEEKRQFLAKQYMMEKKLVQHGQFFTTSEMENMYQTANEEAHQEEQKRIASEAERENGLPREVRIKLVRDGEKLNQQNFPKMMNRFLDYAYRPVPRLEENENRLQHARKEEEYKANHLRGDAFAKKLFEMLTPDQKEHVANSVPQSGQDFLKSCVFNELKEFIHNDEYVTKKAEAAKLDDGPRKEQLLEEIQRIDEIGNSLDPKTMSLEDAKQLCAPYMTQEQLNSPRLTPSDHFGPAFFVQNYNAISQIVPNMLNQEQLEELNQTVENYIVPWERNHEQMGVKVYTNQTEHAKFRIGQMTELNGKPLTIDMKFQMQADLDAANDYVRAPRGEDPNSAYFSINTEYESAALNENRKDSKTKMLEEGLNFDTTEDRFNATTATSDMIIRPEMRQEHEKWLAQDFKFSPETKQAVKHVFAKMSEYGYGGKGVVGEEGTSKQYGLSKLANTIYAYKSAVVEGDPIKMVAASKTMLEEKAHVDEMLDYVRQNFPTDRFNDNFAKPGNIDVVRSSVFPPELRYDDATVSTFNGLYIMMNFAEANNVNPEEFLENPAKYIREYYLDKSNVGLNKVLSGKTGGAAMFEASIKTDDVESVNLGSGRAAEALYFIDKDPKIRAHNRAVGEYIEQKFTINASLDRYRRVAAYRDGHMDRFLFVEESLAPATLLGVPIYDSSKFDYDQPKEFNEREYLQNNGKSLAQMKELLDKNIKEFLYQNELTRKQKGGSICAISRDDFIEYAQKAATKILIAKHAEKDDPSYEQLKGILTNGHEYINNLVLPEKEKVQQTQLLLANAKEGLKDVDSMIDDRLNTLANDGKAANPQEDPELQMLIEIKEQRNKEITDYQTYLDANKAYLTFKPNTKTNEVKPAQTYIDKINNFERTLQRYGRKDRSPFEIDFAPDENFNTSIRSAQAEITSIDARIDKRMNEIVNNSTSGDLAKDEQIQVLSKMKQDKLDEIAQIKSDYIEQLGRDVEANRISNAFKEARIAQINDPNYKFDSIPPLFPTEMMSKDQYLNSLTVDLKDYDDLDKETLYQSYLEKQDILRQAQIEEFALRREEKAFGFESSKAPEVQVAEPIVQQAPQQEQAPEQEQAQAEQAADFSGRWFEPGTVVTKEALIQKLEGMDEQFAEPAPGDNWLEKHNNVERRGYEQDRMKQLFDEGWNVLNDEQKQAVFDTLSDDIKKTLEAHAITNYTYLLKAEGKSQESKDLAAAISKQKGLTLEQVEQMTAGFLTDEEKAAAPRIKPYNHIKYETDLKDNPQPGMWKTFVNALPEDQLQQIAKNADNYISPMEKPLDEVKVEHYGKEVEEAKAVLDSMSYYDGKELDDKARDALKDKLDRAKDLCSGLESHYESALAKDGSSKESDIVRVRKEEAIQGLKDAGFDVEVKHRGFVFNGMTSVDAGFNSAGGPYEYDVIKPEATEQFNGLKEYKFQLSEDTKQSVKNLFAKFDEYGYDQSEFAAEEGASKVYGLHRYHKAVFDFTDKIESSDPVEKMKAVEAADKMLLEYDRAKELIADAREITGADNGGFYPGNVDVQRTKSMPPEFRADFAGVSSLNGLYILYRTLKSKNANIDEFLDDPSKYMHQQVFDSINKFDPNTSLKGKTGAEAIYDLAISYDIEQSREEYAYSRSMETISKMEKDPEMAKNNMMTEAAYALTDAFAHSATVQRTALYDAASHRFDRYLMVSEPQEDASLLGLATTDFETMTMIPAREFDEVGYLVKKQEDPQAYADRIMGEGFKLMTLIQQDRTANGDRPVSRVGQGDAVMAMQRAAIKFLAARPDIDKNSEAYRTLNSLANNAPQFIQAKMTEKVQSGELNIDPARIKFDSIDNNRPSQSLADFKKSAEMRNFGENDRTADKNLNRTLKNLQANLDRAERNLQRANSAVARAEAEQQVQDARNALNGAINTRKNELLQEFRAGRITEEYLDKRNDQLDNKRFGEKVPKMFAADELLSQNDYLRKEYPDDFARLSRDEKNARYQHYVDTAKRTKDAFVAQKYLESEKLCDKIPAKTTAERVAENERLARNNNVPVQPQVQNVQPAQQLHQEQENVPQQPNHEQVQQNVQPQVNVNNEPQQGKQNLAEQIKNGGRIDIYLDEIDENQLENKEDKIVDNQNELVEDKQVEANKQVEEGERIWVDLDDVPEFNVNNDILNVGKEVNLNKDPLAKQ